LLQIGRGDRGKGQTELRQRDIRINIQSSEQHVAEDKMTLRLSGKERIHNFRDYPGEIVADLRATLAAGAAAEPDPHRDSFFAVSGTARNYYIHVAPDSSVWLLASWPDRHLVAAEATSLHAACL
jgi:hypothetical protein